MESKDQDHRNKPSIDFWREHIAKADKFSGTQNEYCRQQNISQSKLSYYKAKLAAQNKFVKVSIPKPVITPHAPKPIAQSKPQIDPGWLASFLRELLK